MFEPSLADVVFQKVNDARRQFCFVVPYPVPQASGRRRIWRAAIFRYEAAVLALSGWRGADRHYFTTRLPPLSTLIATFPAHPQLEAVPISNPAVDDEIPFLPRSEDGNMLMRPDPPEPPHPASWSFALAAQVGQSSCSAPRIRLRSERWAHRLILRLVASRRKSPFTATE